MTDSYKKTLCRYHQLNSLALRGGIVLLGSSFAKTIPLTELRQDLELDCSLYNRSFDHLLLDDAEQAVRDCVMELSPKKLFLQLGESDLATGTCDLSSMLFTYERLLAALRSLLPGCRVTLVSVCKAEGFLFTDNKNSHSCTDTDRFNAGLRKLAARTGCEYADISQVPEDPSPEIKAFYLLRRFFLERRGDCGLLQMLYA